MSDALIRASVRDAAIRGDDDALALIVRAYHNRVYRFGVRVCRDRFDADDAVQEAFAKLADRPEVVRDPAVFSWLMTVVRNACIRMLRPFLRDKRAFGERSDEIELVEDGELDPLRAVERWRLVHAVHAAIATLERPYREVLIMRDLEGLRGDEVCTQLGLTEATMKTRLHRARVALRDHLEKLGFQDSTLGAN